MKELLNNENQTMSSLEIAKLTGKEHTGRVVKDILHMCDELDISMGTFAHVSKNHRNQSITEYLLPKRECLILVSGYSLKLRSKIIDRWQELEEIVKISGNNSRQPSKSYDDFLRDLMETCKDDPEMIKSQAHLGSKALSNARRAKKWYREQFLPHFRFVLGITEHGDTSMIGYTNNPQTLEQISYKFTKQWPDLLYLSCSSQNDLFSA